MAPVRERERESERERERASTRERERERERARESYQIVRDRQAARGHAVVSLWRAQSLRSADESCPHGGRRKLHVWGAVQGHGSLGHKMGERVSDGHI